MMTKKQIKKALVLCQDGRVSVCRDCPYTENCGTQLYKDALALIKKQEKDIKQLKTECALLNDELRIARQDTINVLNELKTKSYVNNYCREVVEVEKIDEMIKELVK